MKANLVLAVILLLLATIYFSTETENKLTPDATDAFNPLLKGFDENSVTRIVITKGDETVVIIKNNMITKQRNRLPEDFPGEWLVENAKLHPAKTETVSEFLTDLTNMKKGFKTSETTEIYSDDADVYKKFGVDEDDALKIQLFKQVSSVKEEGVAINEIPYFALLIGKSSETDQDSGINERFVRLGNYDYDKKIDIEKIQPEFKYGEDIRRVKAVNLELINSDINKWINLDVFKLKDTLKNVDDFQCINITNNDDTKKSIYLAKSKTERTDQQGNVRTQDNWNFYDEPINGFDLEVNEMTEEADNNSVRDFLYELKAFKAKGFLAYRAFSINFNGDLNLAGEFNGRLIVQGELHKFLTDDLKENLRQQETEIRRLKARLYTMSQNDPNTEEMIQNIGSKLYRKMITEESKILKFFIYEESKNIKDYKDLKAAIEDSGKSIDDIATALEMDKVLLQKMIDGEANITPDIVEKIRSEYPYMFLDYWMILTTSRFDVGNYFIHWQYSISHDQLQRLSPERTQFEIPKQEENQTQPSDDATTTDDDETPADDDNTEAPDENGQQTKPDDVGKAEIIDAPELPQVKIVTNYGDIIVELYEDDAPNTVANFISLCEQGFYNDIRFHKIFNDSSLHVGCPYARESITDRAGSGDAGYKFSDEIKNNKRVCKEIGSLLMDNTEGEQPTPDSNGSRIFFTLQEQAGIEKVFTLFGKIISGLDIAQKIGKIDTVKRPDLGMMNSPVEDVYIIKTVVLKKRDHEYKVIKIEDE